MEYPISWNLASASEPLASAPDYELYAYRAVGLASFLGMPLGGSILLALNYRRLGDTGMAATVLAGGLIVSLLIAWLVFALPGRGGPALPIPGVVGTMYPAKGMQGEDSQQHMWSGGGRCT